MNLSLLLCCLFFCEVVGLHQIKFDRSQSLSFQMHAVNISWQELVSKGDIGWRQKACMSKITANGHYEWDYQFNESAYFIGGTTFWLNQWMHIGHVMCDLILIQLLRSVKLDRLILQRSQCFESCIHSQQWNSWFRGYYTAAVLAAGYDYLPIYIRPRMDGTHWSPRIVGRSNISVSTQFPANEQLCFENVFYSTNDFSFFGKISLSAVLDFKNTAYSMLREPPLQLHSSFSTNDTPIKITLFDRTGHTREIIRPSNLMEYLAQSFPSPKFSVQFMSTSDKMTFGEQVYAMAETTVAIAVHGAFMSNVIFMRPQTLMIGLHGNYTNSFIADNNLAYATMARDFLVYYENVTIADFVEHHKPNITITTSEYDLIRIKLSEYFKNKYRFLEASR